ncbi:hypothetical protein [Nocardia sp. NPDC019395]|uniref:hypothetical protein n=1 Tax=Nocardia sp. NPDC019395 TaxID=3154686 RepID=UPI0033DDD43A
MTGQIRARRDGGGHQLVGWRAAFWATSVLTAVLVAWISAAVPDCPGTERGLSPTRENDKEDML